MTEEEYILSHIDAEPPLLARIDHDTHVRMIYWHMCSGHLQGRLLKMLVRMTGARKVLEIGTFSAYATLCLAEGMADDDCHVDTIELNDETEDFIRDNLAASPYGCRVSLHIGDARDVIATLPADYDLIYIDANKRQYVDYYEPALAHLREGGFLVADNTLWADKVIDPDCHDAQTEGIRAFNDLVAADTRVEKVILPLRDGLTLIHKLPVSV